MTTHEVGVLLLPITVRAFVTEVTVGSEVARLRAGHRPPPKLHVRFSRMQLSRRRAPLRRQ